MASFYFTDGFDTRIHRYTGGKWILVQSYHKQFERSSRPLIAKSVAKDFLSKDISSKFDSEDDAKKFKLEFRQHVEYTIRGTRNPSSHYGQTHMHSKRPAVFEREDRRKRTAAIKKKVNLIEKTKRRRIAAEKMKRESIDHCQKWRSDAIAILDDHICREATVHLLREPPQNRMIVSSYVRVWTLRKAMLLIEFLRAMHERDTNRSHFEHGGQHVIDLASYIGNRNGSNKTYVYQIYKEWREGERARLDIAQLSNTGFGLFEQHRQGSYERRWLMEEDDLKSELKRWM